MRFSSHFLLSHHRSGYPRWVLACAARATHPVKRANRHSSKLPSHFSRLTAWIAMATSLPRATLHWKLLRQWTPPTWTFGNAFGRKSPSRKCHPRIRVNFRPLSDFNGWIGLSSNSTKPWPNKEVSQNRVILKKAISLTTNFYSGSYPRVSSCCLLRRPLDFGE